MRLISSTWLTLVIFLMSCCGAVAGSSSGAAADAPSYRAVIDTAAGTLTVWDDQKQIYVYNVAVKAKPLYGEFCVAAKSVDHSGENSIYILELDIGWSAAAIGYGAENCLFELSACDAAELYSVLPLEAPVTVLGAPNALVEPRVNAQPGDVGQDIVTLQLALSEAGCWCGRSDGRFNELTTLALRQYQALMFKPVSGRLDAAAFSALFRN